MKCVLFVSALLVLAGIGAAHSAVKLPPNPDVMVRIVDPAEPRLLITNTTSDKAQGVNYWIRLWNVDNLAGSDALLTTRGEFTELAPRATGAPVTLFKGAEVRASLKPGDRIVGAIAVHCGTCVRGYIYRVYLTYGESGWFAEIRKVSDAAIIAPEGLYGGGPPRDGLKETLLDWVDGVEHGERTEIVPLAP